MERKSFYSAPQYESPSVEIINVTIEKGFASSTPDVDPFEKPNYGGEYPW